MSLRAKRSNLKRGTGFWFDSLRSLAILSEVEGQPVKNTAKMAVLHSESLRDDVFEFGRQGGKKGEAGQ